MRGIFTQKKIRANGLLAMWMIACRAFTTMDEILHTWKDSACVLKKGLVVNKLASLMMYRVQFTS
jgi:hypothetical protein